MPRQYIAVQFSGPGSRLYTYHNDGPRLEVGDDVEVLTGKQNSRGYQKRTKLKIVSLVDDKPPFPTKQVGIPVDPGADLIEDGAGP